ncbi:RDD family protein [Halopiger djelfimassiliensis]|uniref:RDD family protein n=1 Tax=Halopiger djelfimassiliensis TaxID=1293047 RepID=UPI0006782C18|nr:RDD family protein [Halopiger djelfimassiliensis]
MEKHPEPRMGTNGNVIGQRMLAFLIDSILLSLLTAVPFGIGFMLGESFALLMMLVALVISLVYLLLLEGIYGYTPGKYMMGLVVVKSDGSNCTIGASILRNLLRIIDNFPFAYLLGIALMVITDDTQRVGDLVADTVVVERR